MEIQKHIQEQVPSWAEQTKDVNPNDALDWLSKVLPPVDEKGDIVWETNARGRICVSSGSPGVWKQIVL